MIGHVLLQSRVRRAVLVTRARQFHNVSSIFRVFLHRFFFEGERRAGFVLTTSILAEGHRVCQESLAVYRRFYLIGNTLCTLSRKFRIIRPTFVRAAQQTTTRTGSVSRAIKRGFPCWDNGLHNAGLRSCCRFSIHHLSRYYSTYT